jgi:hypothetical protein
VESNECPRTLTSLRFPSPKSHGGIQLTEVQFDFGQTHGHGTDVMIVNADIQRQPGSHFDVSWLFSSRLFLWLPWHLSRDLGNQQQLAFLLSSLACPLSMCCYLPCVQDIAHILTNKT